MHSISPYTIRCYIPTLSNKNKYGVLNKVGQNDVLHMLNNFIQSKTASIHTVNDSKQIYNFSDVNFDEKKRRLSGWFNVGAYGMAGDIIDIKSGHVDFTKTVNNADMIKHYFQFCVPLDKNEGICIFHNNRGRGVKTLFYDIFAPYFLTATKLTLQFNPLSYEKAFQQWVNAEVKELHVTKFDAVKDLADYPKEMGHLESTVIFKSPKGKPFGSFNLFNKEGTDQHRLVEIFNGEGQQIKTVLELNGKRKTFVLGSDTTNSVCKIEVDDDVTLTDGVPDLSSFHSWVNGIIKEFSKDLYPKKEGLS